jgi:hypothetical protein
MCFLNFGVEVGVEKSIVNVRPDDNSDKVFKSNLTFCLFLICNLKNQSLLKRVVDQLFLNLTSLFALFVFLICNLKNQCF